MSPAQGYSINGLLMDENQLTRFAQLLLGRDTWNEYELLKLACAELKIELPNFNDSLSLFQGHFILFNGLYRLIASDTFPRRLVIDVTRINLHALDSNLALPATNAALMAYYLDEDNLINTSRSMIHQMLEQWGIEFAQYLTDEQITLAITQRQQHVALGKN
jgi:hypothetical protein